MGKGKRNSLRRDEEKVINPSKSSEKQNRAKKSKTDRIVAIACIFFAVLIAAVLILNVVSDNGVFLRAKTAVSAGEVEVDATMMSFFLNDYILNWYNQYASVGYLSYLSVDMSRDLRTQPYGTGYETMFLGSFEDVGTWFDYFFKGAYEGDTSMNTLGVKQYVTYANAALKAGMELDAEDEAEIKEIMKSLDDMLSESRVSYSDRYGKGVKRGDVRNCYEIIFLADKFVQAKNDELRAELDKDSDDAIHAFVEENKSAFYSADYISYEIKINSKNYKTDALYDAAVDLAKTSAEAIAAAKTPAEFVSLVEAYEGKSTETESETGTETGTETETGTGTEAETLSPEEELESKIEKMEESIAYETETDNELAQWIFSEGAKENDVKVIEETETETEKATEAKDTAETESGEEETEEKKVYDVYTVTVYMITEASHKDTSATYDYAYLASNDKAEIEKFLTSFKAGELNTDKFVELAQAQYEAVHGAEDHVHSDEEMFEFNGVEKGIPGFNSNYDVLNVWLKDENRKANDISEIFEVTVEGKTYYAVVYFQAPNVEKWEADAYNGVLNERFEAWLTEESKAVVINQDVIDQLGTIMMYTTTDDGHDH